MCGSGTVFPDGGDSILHGADVSIVETGSKGGKDVLSDTDLYAAAVRGTGGSVSYTHLRAHETGA